MTDKMLVAAVKGVAGMSPALADPTAPLLPGVEVVRDVSVRVAAGVVRAAVEEGVATEKDIPREEGELEECKEGLSKFVEECMPALAGWGLVCLRSEREEYPD